MTIQQCMWDRDKMLRSFGLVNLRLPAKLQRLLNAAARLLSGTKKFDRGLS